MLSKSTNVAVKASHERATPHKPHANAAPVNHQNGAWNRKSRRGAQRLNHRSGRNNGTRKNR
ncbi:hypothetical protein D3C71_1700280 [compost metagenome]